MGANLAKKIPESKKRLHKYISKIPQMLNSLVVGNVGYMEIENIIKPYQPNPAAVMIG